MMMLGVLNALRELGLRVPADVSVVSIDDFDFANIMNPPPTVVAAPVAEMAQRAIDTLLGRDRGQGGPHRPFANCLSLDLWFETQPEHAIKRLCNQNTFGRRYAHFAPNFIPGDSKFIGGNYWRLERSHAACSSCRRLAGKGGNASAIATRRRTSTVTLWHSMR